MLVQNIKKIFSKKQNFIVKDSENSIIKNISIKISQIEIPKLNNIIDIFYPKYIDEELKENVEKLNLVKYKNKYFENHIFLFKYEGIARKKIIDYKFKEDQTYTVKVVGSYDLDSENNGNNEFKDKEISKKIDNAVDRVLAWKLAYGILK